MAGYRVDLFRSDQIRSYDSFTLVASSDEEAISEARTHAPTSRPDLGYFCLIKMSGKKEEIIFDSKEASNA